MKCFLEIQGVLLNASSIAPRAHRYLSRRRRRRFAIASCSPGTCSRGKSALTSVRGSDCQPPEHLRRTRPWSTHCSRIDSRRLRRAGCRFLVTTAHITENPANSQDTAFAEMSTRASGTVLTTSEGPASSKLGFGTAAPEPGMK